MPAFFSTSVAAKSQPTLGRESWLLGPHSEGWTFIHNIQLIEDISRAGSEWALALSAVPPSRPRLLPSQPRCLLGQAAQEASFIQAQSQG